MIALALPNAVRRFVRARKAAAMLEFALSLPVVLTLGLLGTETASLTLANLRLSQIAASVADNAGRAGALADPMAAIDEADINEIFAGAKQMGLGIDLANKGRIILSNVEPTSDGTKQYVRWQRCFGMLRVNGTNPAVTPDSSYGVPRRATNAIITDGTEMSTTSPVDETKSVTRNGTIDTPTTGMGPAGRQIRAAAGTAVMYVEAVYDYEPIVDVPFVTSRLFGGQGTLRLRFNSAYNVRQRTDNRVLNAGNLAAAARSTCNRYTN
jgi:hypothetical protein